MASALALKECRTPEVDRLHVAAEAGGSRRGSSGGRFRPLHDAALSAVLALVPARRTTDVSGALLFLSVVPDAVRRLGPMDGCIQTDFLKG